MEIYHLATLPGAIEIVQSLCLERSNICEKEETERGAKVCPRTEELRLGQTFEYNIKYGRHGFSPFSLCSKFYFYKNLKTYIEISAY
jgi:hypothetical protein